MRHTHAFSLFETLLCIMLLSILSIIMLKPYTMESLAINQASLHIQTLQQQINRTSYYAFLQKRHIDTQTLHTLLHNSQTSTKLFSLTQKRNRYILQIGKKQLNMPIKQAHTHHYIITCNPAHELCRRLYHRKHKK